MNHNIATLAIPPCALTLVPHADVRADPLAHTFSIVARDAATGEIGVAAE